VSCDNHNIDAIVEFGRKNRINGTPTMFVADGTRVPGAIDAAQIEALLNAVKP
jgi:thiol:disulfide interchange protein DsbC